MKTHLCLIMCAWLPGALLGAGTFPVPALPYAPLKYPCPYSSIEPRIDGDLDDPAWDAAAWSASFTDIEGSLKPAPYLDTRVKMLWNEHAFFIGARLEEPHIWAKLTEHDSVIFQDNDFEVFIDPNGDTHEYFELELNALGTLWDLFLIKPYRDAHSSLNGWEALGASYAIGLAGTLNNPADRDTAWCVELRLPWSLFAEMAHTPCPPRPGDYWRVNFSRVQWETEIRDGDYVKIPGKPEYNWVWSPQGLIAMHYPERWGYVFFLDNADVANPAALQLPAKENARQYLREVYYAQKQFWSDHGRFSARLRDLKLTPYRQGGRSYKSRLEKTSRSYVATLALPGFPVLVIESDGRLSEIPLP